MAHIAGKKIKIKLGFLNSHHRISNQPIIPLNIKLRRCVAGNVRIKTVIVINNYTSTRDQNKNLIFIYYSIYILLYILTFQK